MSTGVGGRTLWDPAIARRGRGNPSPVGEAAVHNPVWVGVAVGVGFTAGIIPETPDVEIALL